jgi:hypothetical protein
VQERREEGPVTRSGPHLLCAQLAFQHRDLMAQGEDFHILVPVIHREQPEHGEQSRSPDLQRLHQEGYDIEIRSGYLLVKHAPFATSAGEVAFGTLISELSTAGTATTRPADHVVSFAQAIDPTVSARSLMPVKLTEDQSVFRYLDSASSRARISLITGKLALPRVAIVGLGGTGSYVLDLIAKTPASEIHLYDGDTFFAHTPSARPALHRPTTSTLRPTRPARPRERL